MLPPYPRYLYLYCARVGTEKLTAANNYGAPFPVVEGERSEKNPTWWEFVSYLIDTEEQGTMLLFGRLPIITLPLPV